MSRTNTPSETRTMEQNLTDVSFSLAKHVISAKAKDANFVFSPLSIHVVLALIAAGSDGPSRDKLLGFFKSNSTEELNKSLLDLVFSVFANSEPLGGPILSVANSAWFDKSLTLKHSFREIVKKVYRASSNHVDFRNKAEEAREEVNRWAEKETNGLIKEILGPGSVHSLTRLIFANAVYFKANWQDQFSPKWTKDDPFFLLNGSWIQVPFMARGGGMKDIGVYDGFKVLRLPYKPRSDWERRFSMYFFLPNDTQGLPSLVEKAGSESGFIDRHIPRKPVPLGRLRIPKFRIEFGFEASEVLEKQGVVLGGGLTEMVVNQREDLRVSGILHKAFIVVDEHGTEAAAVTVAKLYGSGFSREEPVDFVADHPFMFVIREDESGAVLFIGQLFEPCAGNVVPKRKVETANS